jgi:hypothetical protein
MATVNPLVARGLVVPPAVGNYSRCETHRIRTIPKTRERLIPLKRFLAVPLGRGIDRAMDCERLAERMAGPWELAAGLRDLLT